MKLICNLVYSGYITVIVWSLPLTTYTLPLTGTYDLCKDEHLRISNIGEKGRIVAEASGSNRANPCVLKIESCSNCQIEIRPESAPSSDFFCENPTFTNKFCRLGCDYLFIFDMYYMNETIKYYRSLEEFDKPFKSHSSNVFVGLCHFRNYNFSLSYNATRNLDSINGSSDVYPVSGTIRSPFFPMGYAQSHDVYEFKITSRNPNDFVYLVFDDWNIAESSLVYFDGSNSVGPKTGLSHRPVVISDSNQLLVVFNTGQSMVVGEGISNMGFKATYTFIKDRRAIPNTDCEDSGYLTKYGGNIKFKTTIHTQMYYDCIWVVSTQPGYDGVFLRTVRFENNGYAQTQDRYWMKIRYGVTSEGRIQTRLDAIHDVNEGTVTDPKGFYLRLNASETTSIDILLVFASYKEGPNCNRDPNMYECSSRRWCIHKSLVCDGIDHCGDNSDETSGCTAYTEPWDKSYQYTITIGVIVPMVISVFLIMVICLLFVMVRRCRRARLQESGSAERLRTLSEEVATRRGRRRRRHRRNWFGSRETDLPPTYDEAIQNPPGWYLNVAFGNPVDPTLPCPPSYSEAVGDTMNSSAMSSQQPPGSPTSTDSSQSEVTMCSHNKSSSSSSSDEGSPWGTMRTTNDGRRGRMGRHISSSESEGDNEVPEGQSDSVLTSPSHTATSTTTTDSLPVATNSEVTNQIPAENANVQRLKKVRKSENKKSDILIKRDGNKNNTKKLDDPSQFVIPDGDKPESYKGHGRRSKVKQSGSASRSEITPSHSQNSDHSRNRSISSESDMVAETARKHRKKTKKSKVRKSEHKSSKPKAETSEDLAFEMSGASNFPIKEQHNQLKPETSHPKMELQPSAEILQDSKYDDDKQQHSLPYIDSNLSDTVTDIDYDMVVNVDNNDVLVVYDNTSLHQIGRNRATPPQYMLSGAIPVETVTREPGFHDSHEINSDTNREPLPFMVDAPVGYDVDNSISSGHADSGSSELEHLHGQSPNRSIQANGGSPNRGGHTYIGSPISGDQPHGLVSQSPNRGKLSIDGSPFESPNRGRRSIDSSPVRSQPDVIRSQPDVSSQTDVNETTDAVDDSGARYISLYRHGEEGEDIYV